MSGERWIQAGSVAAAVLAWEWLGRSGLFFPGLFPSVSAIVAAGGRVLEAPDLGLHVVATLNGIGSGFLTGALAGLLAGGLLGWLPPAHRVLEPLLYGFGTVPKIIFFPILLWFLGAGVASKSGMAALSAFFPVAVNTALAVRSVDPVHVRAARLLGAHGPRLYLKVHVPAMLGPIFAGLRLGLGVAIVGALLAETAVARAGLGSLVVAYYSQLRIPEMYALVLVIFVGAALVNVGLGYLLTAVLHYRPPSEGGFA